MAGDNGELVHGNAGARFGKDVNGVGEISPGRACDGVKRGEAVHGNA
jgi:hypothetical protein